MRAITGRCSLTLCHQFWTKTNFTAPEGKQKYWMDEESWERTLEIERIKYALARTTKVDLDLLTHLVRAWQGS